MKKILAALLAVLMIASLFAGCASEKPAESTGDNASTGSNEEIVNLKWVTVGNGMPANYDAWKAKLDQYLEEKIGVHLDVEVIGWGDWDQRRNMIVSTNEPYDIMFTNGNTYYNDYSIGAFTDLSDIIETAAPSLYSYIPAEYWDACRINGKLFAVPTYKDSSMTQYFVYDQAIVEEVYPTYADVHSFADATPVMEAIHDKVGTASMVLHKEGLTPSLIPLKYDDLSTGLEAIGVSYDADPKAPKVVVTFEQEDVKNDLQVIADWYKAGYINSDAAILGESPKYRPSYIAQGWPAAAKTNWGPNMGVEAVAIQLGDTVVSNATVQGSMNCISAACEHPDKALQLLELVNTDPIVRDALFYGLEGDNFDYVEVNGEKKVHKNNTDWTMAGYTQGTFFNVTTLDTDEFNQWDEVKALNESAKASPILGFTFNTEPIIDELAACVSIWKEYSATVTTGTDIAQVDSMLEAMRASGLDKIIAEAQSQVDDWVASK